MGIKDPEVDNVFASCPASLRKRLLTLRALIYQVAQTTDVVGDLEESLKWDEPAYRPVRNRVGTTVRIHWKESSPDQYGLYFNCQTNLIQTFKSKFPRVFHYDGKRGIVFNKTTSLPEQALKECIRLALTYHIDKRRKS